MSLFDDIEANRQVAQERLKRDQLPLVVTPEERETIVKLLNLYFPWLISDEDVSGAEVVDTLVKLYRTLI